jgi:hypothetical protein
MQNLGLTDDEKHDGNYNYCYPVIDEEKAVKIGKRLMELIDSGAVSEYGKRPMLGFDGPPGLEDCQHAFSVENVKSFSEFCLASGGFCIT